MLKSKKKVAILTTGLANIASVIAAFTRLNIEAEYVENADEIEKAERLVIPGVGAFGPGMAKLEDLNLTDAIRERVKLDRPTLGICLGMQLLCDASEEAPGVAGLGIIKGEVTRFSSDEKIPQLGWNKVEAPIKSGIIETGFAYFANSYCLKAPPLNGIAATTYHGERFISALQRGSLLACQFHPELSGKWGSELLGRWSAL